MSPDTKREVARKVLHMSMGLFALCLRWLTPWQAALCALAALLHNLFLFPHYGMKRLERPEEKARGYSGMVGYPAVVLLLILLGWGWALRYSQIGFLFDWSFSTTYAGRFLKFAHSANMGLVAAAWLFLAVGDAFGALCGMLLGGPRLPWNPKKTWSGLCGFLLFGVPAAFAGANFVARAYGVHGLVVEGTRVFDWNVLPIFILSGIVAAVVESLPDQLDDNLTVPMAAWAVLALSMASSPWWTSISGSGTPRPWGMVGLTVLLFLNATLAGIAFWRGWVDKWGFLLGLCFGAVVAIGFGVPGYSLLLLFYLVANGSTYIGKKTKEKRGIAEAHGGQRRTGSVFSKGFVPAVLSLLSFPAFVASLATYAADTAASEFGKTSNGRTLSLRSLKVVPAGSVGAISLRGTVAGVVVLGTFGFTAWCWVWFNPLFPFLPRASDFPFLGFAFATLFCFFFESWFNEWNGTKRLFSKEVIHVMLGGLAGLLIYTPDVAHGVYLILRVRTP